MVNAKGILLGLLLSVSINVLASETETVETTDNSPKECIEYWYLDSVV